jgi:hypothetical protein
MMDMITSRMRVGVWAVSIILVILLLQNSLSDDISLGRLLSPQSKLNFSEEIINNMWLIIRLIVLVPLVVFLAFDRKKPLKISIFVANVLLTLQLFVSTAMLVLSLGADTSAHVQILIKDIVLVMVINVLIFSLWYWLIDSPIIRQSTVREPEPWDFLFPQRSSAIPGYSNWTPGFPDYLFVAFTATFAFGPTDTLPLSQKAKCLMLLQVIISVTTIIVLAGRALSILN